MATYTSSNDQVAGLGVVVRNHEDLVMAAGHTQMLELLIVAYPSTLTNVNVNGT